MMAHHRSLLSMPMLPILNLLLLSTSHLITPVHSHGFLSTPRSRNLVAYEDRIYYPITSNDPLPEDCPNCLNRGGTLARCGVMNAASPMERNYDLPKNALGGVMKSNPQQVYEAGQIIDVEVQLTAHHKGHFVFKACPIANTTEVPTQECFDEHPLHFVSDELYGAPVDVNHPERAYVAPATIENKVYSDKAGFPNTMVFQYKLKLPDNVSGELVLLQWYYVASNSACIHDGYDTYNWPSDWLSNGDDNGEEGGTSAWDQKTSVGVGLKTCDAILPKNGTGLPEQFWNCAEVTIMDPSPQQQSASSSQNDHNGVSKTIIGYYASWQWYDRQKLAKPSNFDFTKVTRVNFAFFQTDADGNIWGTDSWADSQLLFGPYNWNPDPIIDPEYCSWDTPHTKSCKSHYYEEGLIHQVHAAGATIYPSLGGWSLSDPFPEMAANDVARMNFAEKCVELIEEYDFDGLDIDWEYPGYEDHSGTPADTENYNLLLRDLRRKLDELELRTGKFYGLTAAMPCGTNNIANIDIPTVAQYLTEFNLMTYDFFGAWSPTTGANAPVFDQDWGDDDVRGFSVDGCVRNWVNGGASPSAINIGLPFYGRSFLKAKGLNEPHEGNDKNTWFWDDGSPQYFNIVAKLPDLVSVRHESTKTQYAYRNSSTGGLVSYDDEQAICDKTEYCLHRNLNGFIIWEISGDLMPDLSTPLMDTLNDKLTDPSLDCKTLAYNLNSNIPSEDSTSNFLPNQSLLDNPSPNPPYPDPSSPDPPSPDPPSPAPNTAMPTVPLYCPDGVTGPRQYNGCTGYYYCVYGIPRYPIQKCTQGTLFDENSMLCLHSHSVTCSETKVPTSTPSKRPTSVPTLPPSQNPTFSPITSPPVFQAFILLGDKEQHEPTLSAPSSVIPAAPVNSIELANSVQSPTTTNEFPGFHADAASPSIPSSATVATPVDSVESAATAQETTASSVYCPDDYTGVLPWNDCTEYYYCIFAVAHLPTIRCEAGKLFDVESKACLDASQVRCSSAISSLGAKDPPKKQYTESKPLLISNPSKQPTHMPSMSPTHSPSLAPTAVPKHPMTSPTKSPLDLASAFEQLLVENNDANDPQTSPMLDNNLASMASVESYSHQSASLDSNPAPGPESNAEIHDKVNDVSFFWSGTYSSSGVIEPSEMPNTPLPQHFALNRPFITIEILLNDSPEDVGWQLLSRDGSVNVAKPTGSYGSMPTSSVVYEGISLQTSVAKSVGILELRWTIMNVRGSGLVGFKLYADYPIEGNLLAHSTEDFGLLETVELAVTQNGLITVLSSPTSLQNLGDGIGETTTPQNSATTSTEDGITSQPMDLYTTKREPFGTDEYQYQSKENESEQPILILVLVSLVAVAIVTGLVLIVLAHRERESHDRSSSSGMSYVEDDEFDDGTWNLERGGGLPAEVLFNDYSDVDQQQDGLRCGGADNEGNVDPPDSFGGYESMPNTADGTLDDSFYIDYNNTAEEQRANHLIAVGLDSNRIEVGEETENDNAVNIDDLIESTEADLDQMFDTDIYSILAKLEEEAEAGDGVGQTVLS